MGEDLSDVIRNGFDTYRHNLKISIPFLLYLLLISAIFIPIVILLLFGGFGSEELMPLWILVFLLVMLSGFIFLAGAVGMAREATLEGNTTLGTMWTEGKKHYIRVILAEVGLFVILMICMFALLIPLFIIGDADGSVIIFLVFISVMIIFFLFAIALVYIVPVSIVVDNLGAAEGIKRGIGFIRFNTRDMLLISLLYLAASIAIELSVVIIIFVASAIFGFEDVIFSESEQYSDLFSIPANFIELVVLYPLFIVLWTRFYMGRTGKLSEKETEMAHLETSTDKKDTFNLTGS
ncbi:MAG TPA: hypothetical protein HA349_09405 [Methanotrichaceae archaeon]|nr:hypothetical protein [Methanotrichaceae archaeon]